LIFSVNQNKIFSVNQNKIFSVNQNKIFSVNQNKIFSVEQNKMFLYNIITMAEIKIFQDPKSNRIYKVENGVAIRLNSNDLADEYKYNNEKDTFVKLDGFNTIEDMLKNMGYAQLSKGGKKSRKNRKHKRKSATKKRTARKHAY
jgi:hypothetical protein